MREFADPGAFPEIQGFEFLRRDRARVLVRDGFGAVVEAMLDPRLARVVSSAGGGREAHPVIEIEGGERVVVRRYRRGGVLRRLNRGRYFLPGRAFREVRATEHAARAGVRVPTVVAAMERRGVVGYTAAIASLWLEGSRHLADWLGTESGERRMSALREAGSQITAMHDVGITHPDLNLSNLLVLHGPVADDVRVYLIDFDRARIYRQPLGLTRRRQNLRRFARSARKLDVPLGSHEWAALRDGYGAAWPLSAELG